MNTTWQVSSSVKWLKLWAVFEHGQVIMVDKKWMNMWWEMMADYLGPAKQCVFLLSDYFSWQNDIKWNMETSFLGMTSSWP